MMIDDADDHDDHDVSEDNSDMSYFRCVDKFSLKIAV